MKNQTRLAAIIDLILQSIGLVFILSCLLFGALGRMDFYLLSLVGLAYLGIVQVISGLLFAFWTKERVRMIYLAIVVVYLFMLRGISKKDWLDFEVPFSYFIFPGISVCLAIWYFFVCWVYKEKI
jgi:hypothetical protein